MGAGCCFLGELRQAGRARLPKGAVAARAGARLSQEISRPALGYPRCIDKQKNYIVYIYLKNHVANQKCDYDVHNIFAALNICMLNFLTIRTKPNAENTANDRLWAMSKKLAN